MQGVCTHDVGFFFSGIDLGGGSVDNRLRSQCEHLSSDPQCSHRKPGTWHCSGIPLLDEGERWTLGLADQQL